MREFSRKKRGAIEARYRRVEQDQIRLPVQGAVQSGLGHRQPSSLQWWPLRFQAILQSGAHRQLVLDDQNAGHQLILSGALLHFSRAMANHGFLGVNMQSKQTLTLGLALAFRKGEGRPFGHHGGERSRNSAFVEGDIPSSSDGERAE